MQEDGTTADAAQPDSDALSWAKTHEKWKTIRILIVCVAVVVGIWIIADAVVQILDKPAWVVALNIIGGVLIAIAAPTPVILVLIRTMKKHTRSDHQRVIELEKQIDDDRSSSGLADDGGIPKGEP